jgi:outer membrane biosynthesis protein TonB
VTTPPTPAGWYPDPDGSGGQRYWDGSVWTEHRSPAAPEPTAPTAPAEPPASEQPTTVVPLRPAGDHVGAHRAPEPEPEQEPTPEPVPTFEPVPPPEPEPPPAEPSYASAPLEPPPPGEPQAPDDRRKLLIWFGAACAALLAVLVLVVIYGLFINKPETTSISSGPSSTSKSATPTTSSGNGSSSTETTGESPTTASGSGAKASDGGLTFAVTSTETGTSVQYQDAPVEKVAQGEFFVVHMTVLNSGDAQGTFLATLQKLKAGGTTYSIDDEATAYLNGTWADLNPGDTADVAIAFDVPPGTTPESLEVHGDPMSTGVDVPLS